MNMGRLVVRSKSKQNLRNDATTTEAHTNVLTDDIISRSKQNRKPTAQHQDDSFIVRSNYVSPSYTPGFEVLSRPKTANAAMAMKEQMRRELMALGSPISVTEGQDTYNFPTPVKTVKKSPRPQVLLSSRSASSPQVQRSDTPDTIGIALGSPSHLAQFERPFTQSPASIQERLFVSGNSQRTPVSTPGTTWSLSRELQEGEKPNVDPSRPKLSRWKSLGGLFARKTPSQSTKQQELANTKPTPRTTGLALTNYHTWEQMPPSPRIKHNVGSRSNGSPKVKSVRMGIERSQTAPTARRNPASPEVPPKDLLKVHIPNVALERYSIMFNGILPNEPGGLLTRRQSRREGSRPGTAPDSLKDLNIPPMPRRRNTTHSPTTSPSYRLCVFPPEHKQLPARKPLLHRPRPLKRSNTAPGALSPGLCNKAGPLSPMSETSELFETETNATDTTEIMTGRTFHTPLDLDAEFKRDEMDRQALTPTPSEPSSPTTPRDDDVEDGRSMRSFNLFTHEPSWEMITIGKVAEPGDRFSGARVCVVENSSPVEDTVQPIRPWLPLHLNHQHHHHQARIHNHDPSPLAATQIYTSEPPRTPLSPVAPSTTDSTTASPSSRSELGEVQVARSMSVTKAQRVRPAVLTNPPRGVEARRGEKLVRGHAALTPTVIELVDVRRPLDASTSNSSSTTTLAMVRRGHKPVKSIAGIVETA